MTPSGFTVVSKLTTGGCLAISNPGDNWHKVSLATAAGLVLRLVCQPADGSLFTALGRIRLPQAPPQPSHHTHHGLHGEVSAH